MQIGDSRLRSPGIRRAGQHRLAGVHPVAVAAHGVDLAVVGDEAERVRQRPGREGVGGEPAVHDRDGAHAAFVAQIRKVLRQLHRREHALVGHGPAGQRREVDARRVSARLRSGYTRRSRSMPPGRCRCVRARRRTAGTCSGMQPSAVTPISAPSGSTGTVAPAEDLETLLGGDGLDPLASGGAGDGILRQEADAGGEGVAAVVRRRRAARSRRRREAARRAAGAGCPRRHRCWVRRRRRRGVRGAPGR